MSAFLSKLAPFATETLTVSNAVKTLTASVYDAVSDISDVAGNRRTNAGRKAKAATVTVDGTNNIRATEEGTAPVAATTGVVYNQNDTKFLESYEAVVKFKMIREGGSDATVQVVYYR